MLKIGNFHLNFTNLSTQYIPFVLFFSKILPLLQGETHIQRANGNYKAELGEHMILYRRLFKNLIGGSTHMTNNMQNLSPRNAFVRFALGSMMTAYGTVQLIRDPKSRRGQMLILVGSMKVAEGATKFCPRKAMSSSMMDMQKMMASNTTQAASASTGAAMNSGANSNQSDSSGSIMQMVGNVAQAFTGAGAGAGAGQNTAGGNTSGTTVQTISDIAQTVAPQVGQMINDVAGMVGNQSATASTNSNANTKKASNNTNANSGNTKSSSANGNNKSQQ